MGERYDWQHENPIPQYPALKEKHCVVWFHVKT